MTFNTPSLHPFIPHLILYLNLFLSCVPTVARSPVAINQIDNRCWEGLRNLKSFRFNVFYRTDVPVAVEARFSGIWEHPDREAWDGFYKREGKRTAVCLRAQSEVQFEKSDPGWQPHPRGLETKILGQIEQVLYERKLEFVREEKGRYLFRFQPQMSLIDPLRVKDLAGILEVEKVSALPVRIYCADKLKSAEWEIRLSGFNRAGRVHIPFVPVMSFNLIPLGPGLVQSEKARAGTILKQRLAELGIEHQLKWTRAGLELKIARSMSARALRFLTGKGRVEVWTGIWADSANWHQQTGSQETLALQLSVHGDAAKSVILQKLLADNQGMRAKVDCELPFQPKLIIEFKERPSLLPFASSQFPVLNQEPNSGLAVAEGTPKNQAPALFVLVVDGSGIDVTTMASDNRFVFSDVGGEEMVRIIAALTNSQPLPIDFQVFD
jgi:hypothetical protein